MVSEKKEESKNLQEINELSSKIFEIAKQKLIHGKINSDLDIDIQKTKEELVKLLNKVDFIDEIEAKKSVSEAMLDIDYINNSEVKVLSLRLGQLYKSQERLKLTNE